MDFDLSGLAIGAACGLFIGLVLGVAVASEKYETKPVKVQTCVTGQSVVRCVTEEVPVRE